MYLLKLWLWCGLNRDTWGQNQPILYLDPSSYIIIMKPTIFGEK